MCGICGEFRFDGASPSLTSLTKMLDVLARRGPDDSGYFIQKNISLGHRRLAVIDLSLRAHQPLTDETLGLTIVFNGTIYNYRLLQQELRNSGHIFHSNGDTEVILKAYAEWGENCVTHLRGMFAFAIWDETRQRLFLARDRLGIKPLYFNQTADYFRFASTLPALLAAGDVDKNIDPIALHHHLTLHAVVPAPHTLLKGVKKVAPATTLTVTAQGYMTVRKYWHLSACRPEIPLKEEEWIEQTRSLLKDVIKNHQLTADVPVGILLSGGLDSSLLVGLMAEISDSTQLFTFSIGFEDVSEEPGNEFEFSDQVVARYQTRHHRYLIPNQHVLERLPAAIAAMAEPMVGQDATAFFLLAEQVRKEVKVVQSGQGADELFAGYFWYPQMESAQGTDLERFRPYYFDRAHVEFLATVNAAYHGDDYTAQTVTTLLADAGAETFLDKVLHIDITTLIVDDPVKRVDNMTMAWGLEARVPFLDHQLVEWAAQMPPTLKLKDSGKYPLKTIARALLPASVIERKKGYFPLPALKYVRGEFLQFMRETLTSTACQQRSLFQKDYVDKLLAAPDQYLTPLQGSKLWHLALLESWLQIHVD